MTIELKQQFQEYHLKNPLIYEAFESMAKQMAARRTRFGAKALMEIIRWNTMLNGGDEFKVNNNYTAYYSRMFEQNNPNYAGLFAKRTV